MNREELMLLSIGENIDRLISLDMRGYGVPRILYDAARKRAGAPVALKAAREMDHLTAAGDIIYFMTGFVFLPHEKGELDGLTGTVLLIRALLKAKDVKPVIFTEEKLVFAMKEVLQAAGVHAYDSVQELARYPHAAAVIGISTNQEEVKSTYSRIFATNPPKFVFAIEKPGRNRKGIYHQGTGIDVTGLCAKVDDLFLECAKKGIPTFAIGDLGNEIGLAAIEETVRNYIPLGDKCACECNDGICVETAADVLVTATTSDWGCYGICAALAALYQNTEMIPDTALARRVMQRANDCDLIDGSGWVIPYIDGIDPDFQCMLLEMLRQTVSYPLRGKELYPCIYDAVLEKGYFDKQKERII